MMKILMIMKMMKKIIKGQPNKKIIIIKKIKIMNISNQVKR